MNVCTPNIIQVTNMKFYYKMENNCFEAFVHFMNQSLYNSNVDCINLN